MDATTQRIEETGAQNAQLEAGNAILRDVFKDRPATLEALDCLERENRRRLGSL